MRDIAIAWPPERRPKGATVQDFAFGVSDSDFDRYFRTG